MEYSKRLGLRQNKIGLYEATSANTSPSKCNRMQIFGKRAHVLSEDPTKSHNFTNLVFVITLVSL